MEWQLLTMLRLQSARHIQVMSGHPTEQNIGTGDSLAGNKLRISLC